MRRATMPQMLIAGLLVLAMVASITGLFGAAAAGISISSPAPGAKVSGVLTVTASARGAARVSYVIFGVDADRPSSTNSAPYTFQLDTTALADGPHRIFAEAYDSYGMIASSKVITVYVRNSAAPLVQARKALPTRVAARPAPPPAPKLASRPAPAVRVAGQPLAGPRPITEASAVEPEKVSAASPTLTARGPMPEPSRVAAAATISPASPTAPEPASRASFAAGATSDAPSVAAPRPARVRGHTVVMNGRPVLFTVAPFVQSGRLQVGFRAMFEGVGAKVSWHSQSRTARSVTGTNRVEIASGSRTARVNGRPVDMGAAAGIREARMMIPLRFFANLAGAPLRWDRQTGVASLEVTERAIAERDSQ